MVVFVAVVVDYEVFIYNDDDVLLLASLSNKTAENPTMVMIQPKCHVTFFLNFGAILPRQTYQNLTKIKLFLAGLGLHIKLLTNETITNGY